MKEVTDEELAQTLRGSWTVYTIEAQLPWIREALARLLERSEKPKEV